MERMFVDRKDMISITTRYEYIETVVSTKNSNNKKSAEIKYKKENKNQINVQQTDEFGGDVK